MFLDNIINPLIISTGYKRSWQQAGINSSIYKYILKVDDIIQNINNILFFLSFIKYMPIKIRNV